VKRAAAAANRDAGVLDDRRAAAIDRAASALLEHRRHLVVDLLGGGGSIGINMNVNEVLANLASEALGGKRGSYEPVHPLRHVNASQSTADVCHTAARRGGATPRQRCASTPVRPSHARARAVLPTLARTCLQDAMPTTADVLFLSRRRAHAPGGRLRGAGAARRRRSRRTRDRCGQGAPPVSRARRAGARRRRPPVAGAPHAADALQNGDDLAAVAAELGLLARALLKVAQDLRLLASGPRGGMGEVRLPHVQAGSSFFAGKSNPVVPESVMQCAFQVLGCERAVQEAHARAELHLQVFDAVALVNVLDALEMLATVLDRFESRCLRDLDMNEERCRTLATP
jgi:aspartate ammonia-lyase